MITKNENLRKSNDISHDSELIDQVLSIEGKDNESGNNKDKLCYFDIPERDSKSKDTFISNGMDSVLIPDEHLEEKGTGFSNSLFNSSGIHTPKESLEAFCLKNNIGKLFQNLKPLKKINKTII